MKRKNREISIFSMSALDLFASAMGAFILIAVVMFPYFPNTGTADQRDLDEALERLQQGEADNVALQGVLSEIRQDLERRLEAARDAARREVDAARRAAEEARGEADAARRETEEARGDADAARQAAEEVRGEAEAAGRELERERRRKFLLVTISWEGTDDVDLHIVDPLGNEFYYKARTHSGTVARFEEDTIRGPGNEVWLHPQVTPGEYKIYYRLYDQHSSTVTVRGSIVHSVGRVELQPRRLRQEREKPRVATVVVDADRNIEVRY